MLRINDYGKKLIQGFQEKINYFDVIEQDDFYGMCFFESDIENINDAASWMMLTYDTDALYWVENWLDEFGDDWIVSLTELKKELVKCIEED